MTTKDYPRFLSTTAFLREFHELSRDDLNYAYRRGVVAPSLLPTLGATRHMRPEHMLALLVGHELWKGGMAPAMIARTVEGSIRDIAAPDVHMFVVSDSGQSATYTAGEAFDPGPFTQDRHVTLFRVVLVSEFKRRINKALEAQYRATVRPARGAA